MTTIRSTHLPKFIRWLINLALYAQIGAVVFIFSSLIFILSGEGELISQYEVELSQPLSNYELGSKNASLNDLQLVVHKGVIQFSSRKLSYYALKLFDTFFVLTVSLLITLLLKKIIRSIENDQPFTHENTLRIKNIAFLLISITPYSFIQSIIYRNYILSNITVEGFQYSDLWGNDAHALINGIWVGLDLNVQPLLLGAILITLAVVFRTGVLIRLDNESIL